MKRYLAIVLLTLSAFPAFSAQIECFDKKTGHAALFVADDMGSITTGGVTVNGKAYSFGINEVDSSRQAYSYYYGEYLTFKGPVDGDQIEVALVKTKKNHFEGKIAINPQSEGALLSVSCRE